MRLEKQIPDYTGPWLSKLGRYWGLRPKCASGDGRQQEKTLSIARISIARITNGLHEFRKR